MGLVRDKRRKLLRLSYRLRGPLVWDLLRGRRVRILIYHGITAEPLTGGLRNRYGYAISRDEFAEHVDYLQRRCHVVQLDAALRGEGLSRTRMNVVISFDDGYGNGYTNAFPILAERGLPSVYALATGFVAGRVPLFVDVLEQAAVTTERARVTLAWDGEEQAFEIARDEERVRLYDWLMVTGTTIEQSRCDEFRELVAEALDVSLTPNDVFQFPEYRPFTPEQITEMQSSGLVEFASHSVSHAMLTRLAPEHREREYTESKACVEALTGRPCKTFCVPGGQYDAGIAEALFAAGYERVLTSDGGVFVPGRRLIGRTGVLHHTDPASFADLVHGPVDWALGRLRRA